MKLGRRLSVAVATVVLSIAIGASPASAIVGGSPAAQGQYPSVAEVNFAIFGCTGTLIAPNWVLTAGHCGSVTGAVVGTPIGWPPPLFTVRIGSATAGAGEKVAVAKVFVSPKYLLTDGNDITLLQLRRNSAAPPTKVAGAGERGIWNPGQTATIAGFGITSENGSAPGRLYAANVPIVSDGTCGADYSNFDVTTMVCAGFPQGGVDTCQGDSGGPLFGRAAGALKVVGSTSFGEGCARPNKPGVYARVADSALREWIRSKAPNAVD